MRCGLVILPDLPWTRRRDQWRTADELGFDHAWTYDHLVWRERVGATWHAAVPTLAAAALETARIRLGTLVASPNFRHPVPLAQEFMTLDDLAGGRMILGIGAGTEGIDAATLGHPPEHRSARMRRFAEFSEVLDRLLTTGQVSYAGEYFRCETARVIPGCVQWPRAPIAVAATGPQGLAIAARHAEIWVTNGVTPTPGAAPRIDDAVLRRQSHALDEACVAIGRDPRGLRRLVVDTSRGPDAPTTSAAAYAAATERYAALGFTDLVTPFPEAEGRYRGDPAVLEQIAVTFQDRPATQLAIDAERS